MPSMNWEILVVIMTIAGLGLVSVLLFSGFGGEQVLEKKEGRVLATLTFLLSIALCLQATWGEGVYEYSRLKIMGILLKVIFIPALALTCVAERHGKLKRYLIATWGVTLMVLLLRNT